MLQLVAEGRLSLDAPVVRHLPRGYTHLSKPFSTSLESNQVVDSRLDKVTVRMALNHTTGLPNWAEGPLQFDFDPGIRWQYSGEAYLLLQRAVETVTGEDLDRLMDKRVFQPLGMLNSSYVWEDRFEQLSVPGHAANGAPMTARRFKRAIAATTLYTTAGDYGRFLAAWLNNDRAIAISTQSPVSVDPQLNLSWGLGWGIEGEGSGTVVWHWGNNPGYRSLVVASPAAGEGVVVFTNSDDGLRVGRAVVQSIMPGRHRLFDFRMLQLRR